MKQRVVSLLPSCTEIVCALGRESQLVGRSHECDFPESIKALPVLTSAKVDSTKPSGEIHKEVGALIESTLSLYQVDMDRLKQVEPHLILTQAQCEVCAVTEADLQAALAQWTGKPPRIRSLSPKRLVDIWDDIRRVAEALYVEDLGKAALKPLKLRCVDVIEKVAAMKKRQTVACIEWLEPLMVAGNWVPELVDLAGGRDVLGESGRHSPWIAWEALVKADPEVIYVMPCGFDISRALRELPTLAGKPEWKALRAVKNHRVYVVDGNQYFNRPGPRIVDSLEIIAETLHPLLFDAKHKDTGWEQI